MKTPEKLELRWNDTLYLKNGDVGKVVDTEEDATFVIIKKNGSVTRGWIANTQIDRVL